jgi:hypothetical protein
MFCAGWRLPRRLYPDYEEGDTAVIDCMLLARCDFFIKNRSVPSDVSLAFDPDLPWEMILGEEDRWASVLL